MDERLIVETGSVSATGELPLWIIAVLLRSTSGMSAYDKFDENWARVAQKLFRLSLSSAMDLPLTVNMLVLALVDTPKRRTLGDCSSESMFCWQLAVARHDWP
ncbi:hypothetical protein ACKVWM_011724 [Pyricularia oryzae]